MEWDRKVVLNDEMVSGTRRLRPFYWRYIKNICIQSVAETSKSLNRETYVGWREINQQDATNPMFITKLLSEHVSGHHYAHHQENKTVYYCIWCSALVVLAVVVWSWVLTFWRQNYFFLILAHSVYKMWIIQEQNTLELWNYLHFEEEKTESIYHF